MISITDIVPNSIASSLSLTAGDRIVSVNDDPVRDFLDVLLAEKLPDVTLVVEKTDGERWQLDIEKEVDAPLGIILEHPEPKRCGNNCIFCFVHQLPQGMRQTLYVKDEDYRFSYLYGAYITLSNLTDTDIERIIAQKLSPLYISVHAIDESVRSRMLGRSVPAILPQLKRLVENGIAVHSQIVVCPQVNDGNVLVDSVEQLQALYPGILTLALVPLGLTAHRDRLEPLQLSTRQEAMDVLSQLSAWQKKFVDQCGSRFVFAADEFYQKAEAPIPEIAEYEELAQLENGVGLIALFRREMQQALVEAASLELPVEFSVVTGQAFFTEMQHYLQALAERTGCHPHLYAIRNDLFGTMVTVAGLVTGQDIVAQLKNKKLGTLLLVPDVMMRDGDDYFLDDMTRQELAEILGCQIVVVPDTPWGILEALEAAVIP